MGIIRRARNVYTDPKPPVTYLKSIRLNVTNASAGDGCFMGIRCNDSVYCRPYRCSAQPYTLNVYTVASLESNAVVSGSTVSLGSVPNIYTSDMAGATLGTTSSHTYIFYKVYNSTTMYTIDPTTGGVSPAFTGVDSGAYGQCVFDENTNVLFVSSYSNGVFSYECSGSTYPYACSNKRLILPPSTPITAIGIDIYNDRLFISSYSSKVYVSMSSLRSNMSSTDFGCVINTPPSGPVSRCTALWTTNSHLYWGGYGPDVAVYTL